MIAQRETSATIGGDDSMHIRKTGKTGCLLLAAVFLLCAFGCENTAQISGEDEYPVYTSYRDIPGVTEDEISAIEDLRSQKKIFVYGMNLTTETFYNRDGEIEGYSALLCDWLTKLFDIPFEPAVYEWGALLDGLESHEIDFTGELTATDERRKIYLMTDAIAERSTKFMRIAGSEELSEIAKSRTLRYAFLDGTTTYEQVAAATRGPFRAVFVDDYSTAYRLLKSGEADAFFDEGIAEAAFDEYGDVTAEDFFPRVYGSVSLTTQNPEFAAVISVVQKALQNGAVHHLIKLYNQGEDAYLRHKLFTQLTEDEQAYIRERAEAGRPVLLAAEYDNYPSSFYNDQENVWQGVSFDVLQEVSALTGLVFTPANDRYAEWSELLDMLESGEADMVTELIRSQERENRFLWADTPYQTDYYALLSKAEYEDIGVNEISYLKVGLIKDTAYTEMFKKWFPDHTDTVEYDGTADAFEALERGEADLVMATRNLLLSMTNFLEKPGFKANIVFNQDYESLFGFNIEQKLLRSVVSKALRLIDTENISDRWERRVFDYRGKMARAQIPWLIGAAILLFCVLALLLAMFLRRGKEGKKLEAMVLERTEALQDEFRRTVMLQKELERSRDEALSASRAKSDFLANMSHEIRTPMNAIIGMTSIGKSASDAERKDYAFGKIEDASTHLLGVINDILDMSKIEANKLELSVETFNFEKMLRNVVNVVNFRVDEKHQDFTVRIDRDIPRNLVGDDQRLAQVITNLLSNAVKFTPEYGSVRLDARFVEEENGICTIEIAVTDTGIGISEEQQSRLFGAFQQAESDTSRKFGGTGLGLAISKRIVEMMGGRIWIESEPGKGAAFAFTVRAERGAEDEKRGLLKPGVNRSNIRMLAVDDAPEIREYFSEITQGFGVFCDVAATGAEAVALIERTGPYDIYFVDFRMPGMDGIELSRRIKEYNKEKSVVIMISSTEWSAIEDEAKAAGVDRFMPKPLFPSVIADCISECLGVGDSSAVAAQPAEETRFEGYRVLLAEDVEINREIVLALLEPTGLSVDCAENGAAALAMFEAAPGGYDMIFMDVQMPQMDGYEATRRIRALDVPKAKTIPIIAMTANVFREDVERCLESGMNDHVGKPLDLDEVLKRLRDYLPQ
jgi:signal transduction histidine kinase/DNA-binding response OmpR family regulator